MSEISDTQPAPEASSRPWWPQSWLGFKIVDQATVDEAASASLPSAQALAGHVWLVLYGPDGEPIYVAGIVVAATFTASKVKYSLAFPMSPQPKEGVTLYAVVDNIESERVVAQLPEGEGVFDSVLDDTLAPLLPGAEAVLDSANPLLVAQLEGRLIERRAALLALGENADPLAELAIAGEVVALVGQIAEANAAETGELDPLATARARVENDPTFKKLTRDFTGSLATIKAVDEGTARGWDRSLFASSIVNKVKTQAKNDPQLAAILLAWLAEAQSKFAKPAITARNGVWSAAPDWEQYRPLFGGAAPAPAVPQPTVKRADDFADSGEYDVTAPDGKTYKIYRDPESGWWYQADTGRHFSDDFLGFTKEEAVKAVIERGFQRPAPADVQLAQPAPAATVSGDELGQFETTDEGKRQLRDAAKSYFKDRLLGTAVFNKSLDKDIEIQRAGMKKVLSFSADPRKLKLVPALPTILADAVSTRKLPLRGDEPRVVAVHVLKADVALAGDALTVRVIVKERDDGSFFYDHSVNKEDLGGSTEVLDSVDGTGLSLLALLCTEPSAQQVLLDSVGSSGEVFNLFIEGEAPEVATVDGEDDVQPEPQATEAEGRAALAKLKPWMPRMQYSFIQSAMNGEEAQYFFDKMVEMSGIIAKMPKTYEQDGMGHKAVVSLHYFRGSSDWYITERDKEGKGTEQAFGLAILNGDRQNAELGYISIDELVDHNVELDLNWEKQTVGAVRKAIGAADDEEPEVIEPTPSGRSAQFESYRAYIEQEQAAGRAIPAGMLEQIRADERLNDGEAADLAALVTPAPAPAIEPQPQQDTNVNMETFIKVGADSIEQLARINVYRVLNEAGAHRAALADYIATKRPDLAAEVASVMAEEWADLNWKAPDAPAPVAKVELPGGGDASDVTPDANPQRAVDIAFLKDVVSKNVDMWADDLAERIEKIGEAYAGDVEVEALWGQAIEAYTNFMAEAMAAA